MFYGFLVSECPEGRYGPGCTFNCDCANGATCDPKSGACNCIDQWIGSTCEQGEC